MIDYWTKNAVTRNFQIESGKDITFLEVFLPYYKSKVKMCQPKKVLEIGAGTGHLALEISKLGIDISAIEPSSGMFNIAKEKCKNMDIKNCAIGELEEKCKYDLIIAHLVAHTTDDFIKFINDVKKHLKGKFIFSVPHPCFFKEYKNIEIDNYQYINEIPAIISFNISLDDQNEINSVPYVHRPLSFYINSLIDGGYKLEKITEIFPDIEIQKKYPCLWENPRYCIIESSFYN